LKTVLIPPILRWGMLKQLPQQIAQQFVKHGYQVIFLENPNNGFNKIEVEPNLFVYGNANQFLTEFNEGRIRIDVLYNTWAKNYNWVNLVKPKVTIYHSCDSFDDWKIYENQMMEYADIILCTSQFLYDLRKSNHKNVHLVRNGCSDEFLDSEWSIPPEMKFIKPPIFNFTGACGAWVSTYLLKKIANDYATVFIGTKFGKEVPDNLFNFGVKEHDALINYYYSSDICLLPFTTNSEITQAACPIKLYEYLSCGKPVLTTEWAETSLDTLEGVVFPAKTNEDFIELGHELAKMTEDDKAKIAIKAKAIARNNTWEKRFEQIQIEINKFYNK
jgi:hypothetical protein